MELKQIMPDINGNPRYVCHFLLLANDNDRIKANDMVKDGKELFSVDALYKIILKKSNLIGGKKYHNKSYGGGIVFSRTNKEKLIDELRYIKYKQNN